MTNSETLKIYSYGISSERILSVIQSLNIPVELVYSISDAECVLTTKSQLKNKAKLDNLLEGRQLPLHVVKQNNRDSLVKFMKHQFRLSDTDDLLGNEAIDEIKQLCKQVITENKMKEASPRDDTIRRVQHAYVTSLGLNSLSVGEEPNRRVRVYPKG